MHINLFSFSCSISRSTSYRCHLLVFFDVQIQEHVGGGVHRLRLWWRDGAETMEMVNLKLYLENRCIIAENERLRERASALRHENFALRGNLSETAATELPAAGEGAA
jgi:hypothetical protein